MESDQLYYRRRATEERNRALNAITVAARERHRELASLFESKAQATRSRQRELAD